MWSYGGWERVCQCFDEIKEPKRNMPIIISGNISKFKSVNEGNQNGAVDFEISQFQFFLPEHYTS